MKRADSPRQALEGRGVRKMGKVQGSWCQTKVREVGVGGSAGGGVGGTLQRKTGSTGVAQVEVDVSVG